jgi:hypothetical protein
MRLRASFLPLPLAAAVAAPASARELYRDEARDLRVALDTTASVGASLRVQGRDCDTIWIGHGGCSANPQAINADDGDLNYGAGDFTSVNVRTTFELEVDWGNFGAFGRINAFYDFLQNDADSPRRTDLDEEARHRASRIESGVVGAQLQFLDAYVEGSWEPGSRPLDVRLGNQLISWGENVFIPGGINQINPVDVSRLRVPGSEIKEALLPSPILRVQAEPFPNFGIDAYYQFWWNRTHLDPTGSFYSTSDLVGRAAQGLFFPNVIGGDPLGPADPGATGLSPAQLFASLRGAPRSDTDEPPSQGQGGIALRYFADRFQTELALYYVHYHSKTPTVGFHAFGLPPVPPFTTQPQNVPVDYFLHYAPNVDLVGASFATQVAGAAFAGEISYRPNDPVALNAIGGAQLPFPIGSPGRVDGFVKEDRLQMQLHTIATLARGTRWVGPLIGWIGADDATLIAEWALVYYPGLDRPCRPFPSAIGIPAGCTPYASPGLSRDVVDEVSWGYQLRLQPTWTNPFAIPVRVLPFVSFQHDVDGSTPGMLPFVEDRKGISLGLDVVYLDAWTFRVAWGNFTGAKAADLSNDRDFVSFSLSYAF